MRRKLMSRRSVLKAVAAVAALGASIAQRIPGRSSSRSARDCRSRIRAASPGTAIRST
ncbi:twin-arginine translocation signal domain-containing protein [Burkholderia territorii]|uniref:twin-arginine translocation signal domain-containing protein n=2 Tax=Burkholderia territorii TaxID=1503055 RepID=UPI0012D99C47